MYTVRFPLQTTCHDEMILEKRFRLIATIHNNVVSFAKKQLRMLRRDPDYIEARWNYAAAIKAGDSAALGAAKAATNSRVAHFGLDRNGVDAFVAVDGAKYKKHLTSQQCQKEAERVLAGVEKVLYGNGNDVHYKKYEDISTICSKSPTNGIRLYTAEHKEFLYSKMEEPETDCILWNGLQIPIKVNWKDPYIEAAMRNHDIAYCEIQRLIFNDGWHYYVRIYFRGEAPKKIKAGSGRMGIDPGVSTMAAVGENAVFLRELAPESINYNRQIIRLQRQIDNSKRASNPDNYNADGTVKRGKHKWEYTKSCLRKMRKLKVLYRKKSAAIRQSHEKLVNLLIQNANHFFVENMNYAVLGKRSKTTGRQDHTSEVRDKRGRIKQVRKFKRKKRFGKSLNNRAPALFLTVLSMKCKQYGLEYTEAITRDFKASQLDHTTGVYTPSHLNQRFKVIGGHAVQRDLYSAFLLRNSAADGSHANLRLCKITFPAFLDMHDKEINDLISNGVSMKQCFGF